MKLIVERIKNLPEVEVLVRCKETPEKETENLIAYLEQYSLNLICSKAGATYPISPADVCYIESVDDRTFLYLEQQVYESPLKLYQIEELLQRMLFVRIGKSVIANISWVESVRPLLNGKLEVKMQNTEKLVVNRHYVKAFREKFEL